MFDLSEGYHTDFSIADLMKTFMFLIFLYREKKLFLKHHLKVNYEISRMKRVSSCLMKTDINQNLKTCRYFLTHYLQCIIYYIIVLRFGN